ncbi:ABC transporter substrate-binding protein [Haloarchaeobius iranensis]|uniref:ABC-type Fe3+-hydroxamate transport system, substrate-binding protein n=1 Tax=Haloarchaeobius iranensis TaxID=996166 RepID=A0A1G9YGV7_9EURY|nr:ABC transporter substrate-binding protein [Haloarchaeobius iranensis]SDN08429.1 ABC-type Fe3+-hydroxamate transport system, substrate-binding protein [Haloarchaeobius iranensis]
MVDAPDRRGESTRREYLTYGGTAIGGALLAGCLGDGDDGERSGDSTTATPDPGETTDPAVTETEGDDVESGPYTVSLSPTGAVTFDSPPESVFTRLTHHAGMAFALGRGDDVNAMHAPDYYHALWNQFTPRLPGVSVDWQGLYSSWQPDKETLFELDSDVHLADPAWLVQLGNWGRDDLDEIAENVGPWFGNSLSDRHQSPPAGWEYEYYSLWEQFGIVADAFRERERYEALATVHDELLARIERGVQSVDEQPTAAMALPQDVDQIYVYKVNDPGFLTAHTRPFEVGDAFGDEFASGDAVDIEGLLAADPDVLFGVGGMHPDTDMAAVRENLLDHPVGRELTAVQDDRVHAQGARYQGPVLNLFQLEMTAKQLYPDEFGEWPRYASGPYPELPAEAQLFDRERVASIVRGEFEG